MDNRDKESIKRKRAAAMKARRRAQVVALGCLVVGMAGGALIGQALAAQATPHYVEKPIIRIVEAEVPKIETVAEPEQPEAEEPLPSLGEFTISHYCACVKCCGKDDGITSTGTVAAEGRTIAVDPKVIPYGTEVVLLYSDGTVGHYIAEDCGGAIKGNRIDVYMDSHQDALAAGMKTAEVYIAKEVAE